MPSQLLTAKIRGVRSYSPRLEKEQTIDFMPLTLIVGANGTGKTTIIESLKFIISGDEPPHSDSRRNFLHTSKNESKHQGVDYASIEIQFHNSSGTLCTAKRDISQPGVGRATPSITSSYKIGKNPWVSIHRLDDWSKTMPKIFGFPNHAILSHVILCHQDDNLWCMSESSVVKQVFDKIFGCEQYKKELKYIDTEIKNSNNEVSISERDMFHIRDRVERKKNLISEIRDLEAELAKVASQTMNFDADIEKANSTKKFLTEKISKIESQIRELESLKQRISELNERDSILRQSLFPLSHEEFDKEEENEQPVKKRAPDPLAKELDQIIENLNKMLLIVDEIPASPQNESLQVLIKNSLDKIEKLKTSLVQPEPPQEIKRNVLGVKSRAERELEHRNNMESRIRANLEQLTTINERVSSLQKGIQGIGETENLRKELADVEKTFMMLRDKRSMIVGSKVQLERQLSRAKSELDSYKRVNIEYAQSLGKLVCNRIIKSDLEKLKECFEQSVMSFHEQMIVKINEVLRARWRQIYQGGDVDTIELVDEEIKKGKDKRTFNYYIAMRKKGLRMKMREKSSAGQKALASIILRMTLAELFVKDFAFITLDEPTANLDLANVQSLAKAIGTYVKRRTKKGANIQWIIITHDENLLRALDVECSPFYYRVQMDQDGCSKIVKVTFQASDVIHSDGDINGEESD